ncbi:MAG: DUF4169 family protein [Pseudomonadota bacterium]
MAEIVNLRQARKAAARKADRLAGDAAAMKSGRTKAQKQLEAAEAAKAKAALDAKKRETPQRC